MKIFRPLINGVKKTVTFFTSTTHDAGRKQNKNSGSVKKHQSLTPCEQDIDRLERALLVWERMIRFMAFPFICLSSWLTTKGLFDAKIEAHAANTEGMITAAMTAIVAAIMIGGATMLLFGLATHATRAQRGKLIMLTVALIPFVGAISTYNAILATSAEKSIILALRDRTIAWEKYVQASMQDSIHATSAAKSLQLQQVSVCKQAHDEREYGALTGSRGMGQTASLYAGSCEGLNTIIDILHKTVSATETRRDQATAILAEMEAIPRNTAITVFERQQQFKDQDRLMHKLLADVSAERVADTLRSQMQMLEGAVNSVGDTGSAFRRRQHQAIVNLKQSLAASSEIIETLIADDAHDAALPPEQMLSVDEAMARYWRSNLSTIVIAVATDSFPLWLISFLFVARSIVQSKRDALEATKTQHSHEEK